MCSNCCSTLRRTFPLYGRLALPSRGVIRKLERPVGAACSCKTRAKGNAHTHPGHSRVDVYLASHLVTVVEQGEDLAVLMRVSRECYELVERQLCRIAGQDPIRTSHDILSFLRFVKHKWAIRELSAPRAELVKRLHRAPETEPSPSGALTTYPMMQVSDILRTCKGLRVLQVEGECRPSALASLCRAITNLKALQALRLSALLTANLSPIRSRRLLQLPLRLFHLPCGDPHGLALTDEPPFLLDLSPIIEDFELPIRNWLLPVATRFPTVRRLKWLPPEAASVPDWGHLFPNLTHLVLFALSSPSPPGLNDSALIPAPWPSLQSLRVEESLCLAAIVPSGARRVARLSLTFWPSSPHESVLLPVLLDTLRPACLELRLQGPGETYCKRLTAERQARISLPLALAKRAGPARRSVVVSLYGRAAIADIKHPSMAKTIVDAVLDAPQTVAGSSVARLLVRHETDDAPEAGLGVPGARPLRGHIAARTSTRHAGRCGRCARCVGRACSSTACSPRGEASVRRSARTRPSLGIWKCWTLLRQGGTW
ncbi:hypothetical protein BD413DRAFT_496784 [Trametes elegans]|nr:hypothetical protein BD413DRAFT_496784 [Trametes elegans]